MIGDRHRKSPTRCLTILYISFLALIAYPAIAVQVVIQRLLSQQQLNIQVVGNVEGQQLLSQKLAKLALCLNLTQDEVNRRSLVEDFDQTIGE